jgi:hypothetical protein
VSQSRLEEDEVIRGSLIEGREELFRHFLSNFDRLDRLQPIDPSRGCQLGSEQPSDVIHRIAEIL